MLVLMKGSASAILSPHSQLGCKCNDMQMAPLSALQA